MRAAGFDDADEIGRGGFGIVYRCTQVDLDRLSWSVGWSYDLCTPAEQQLWRQLSVFAGSFELEAAEDICDGDLAPDELLDLLSALVDKSILTRTEHNGVVRFRMLETLRDYGHEQIRQTDQYAELRRRHADWYRRLLRDAAADWFSPRQIHWMQRLEREGLNIRAALEFSLSDSPETALDIAGTVHPFGMARGISPRLAVDWTVRWPRRRPRQP